VWRFAILLEIVLSGFQLELYNMDERTFAYWYITQITEEHVAALTSLLSVVPKGDRINLIILHLINAEIQTSIRVTSIPRDGIPTAVLNSASVDV
jgi:hypothetical protein